MLISPHIYNVLKGHDYNYVQVSCLLENSFDTATAAQLVLEYNVYPLLLNCLIEG